MRRSRAPTSPIVKPRGQVHGGGDAAEAGDGLVDGCSDRCRVEQVGRSGSAVAPGTSRTQRRQCVAVAVEQREPGAAGGEVRNNRAAQCACRAGDERAPVRRHVWLPHGVWRDSGRCHA